MDHAGFYREGHHRGWGRGERHTWIFPDFNSDSKRLVSSSHVTSDLCPQVSMPHQWLEGNLPVSAKCNVCDKTCGSVLRLQDWRCLWCKAMVRLGDSPGYYGYYGLLWLLWHWNTATLILSSVFCFALLSIDVKLRSLNLNSSCRCFTLKALQQKEDYHITFIEHFNTLVQIYFQSNTRARSHQKL